ncbi:DUF1996 domain-containing protein [Hydrogenophaga palleronii]|uniref:DUF1996 domain-containing protein n=1 Tax=Hydrogenophaga palleronii TaxID=65655 RepID=UPI0009FBF4BB|nr:DUF1996 domain-containing protein [Hydrogenophaga palleronii]
MKRALIALCWTATAAIAGVTSVNPPAPTATDPHQGGRHEGNMPRYNPASIPVPAVGSGEYRVRDGNAQPYRDEDGTGAFRTMCKRSHFNRDDSLLYPAQVGRAHLHMYFGNTASDANSTPQSIRETGNGTCGGGIANRSTYWVPAIIDTSDGTVIDLEYADVYYKAGYHGVRNEDVKPIPAGLRIIAGDMKKSTKDKWFSFHDFSCGDKRETAIPAGCTTGRLDMQISFPQCWDGVNLTSPDQKSHMAYARNGCPASHPVPLPVISYVMHFPIPPGRDTSNWRLSSDNYVGGQGGYSIHADWINGWVENLPPVWTKLIINRGLSGGSYMIGDGRTME